MKKYIYHLFLLGLGLLSYTLPKAQTFQQSYAVTTQNDVAQDIVPHSNGYVIAGNAGGTSASDNVFLLKVGPNATQRWVRNFGSPTRQDIIQKGLCEASSGGGYMLAWLQITVPTSPPTPILYYLHLEKVSLQGNTQFSVNILLPTGSKVNVIERYGNTGYVVAVEKATGGLILYNLSLTGSIVWQKEFPLAQGNSPVCIGVNSYKEIHIGTSSGMLMKVNSFGYLVWQTVPELNYGFNVPGQTKIDQIECFTDGSIIVGGRTTYSNAQSPTGSSTALMLAKFSAASDQVWGRYYQIVNTDVATYPDLMSFHVDIFGSTIYLTGIQRPVGATLGTLRAVQTNLSGIQLLSGGITGANTPVRGATCLMSAYGRIGIAATSISATTLSDPYCFITQTMVINLDGAPDDRAETIEVSKTEPTITPNPTTDLTEIKGDFIRGGTLQVFDSQGKILFSNTIAEYETVVRIDMQNWPKGIYFARLTQPETKDWAGRLLKL